MLAGAYLLRNARTDLLPNITPLSSPSLPLLGINQGEVVLQARPNSTAKCIDKETANSSIGAGCVNNQLGGVILRIQRPMCNIGISRRARVTHGATSQAVRDLRVAIHDEVSPHIYRETLAP